MLAIRNRRTLNRSADKEFDAEISRRSVLARTMNALGILPVLAACPAFLLPMPVTAAEVAADDPRIRTEKLTIGAQWGKLECYLVRPKPAKALLPAVIVAHDKLGLTPHFEDVARRFALEGFIALAPDYASRFGGTPSEPDPALEIVGMTNPPDMTTDTEMAVHWLKENVGSQKIGAVGFGLGGTAVSYAAARDWRI